MLVRRAVKTVGYIQFIAVYTWIYNTHMQNHSSVHNADEEKLYMYTPERQAAFFLQPRTTTPL